MRKLRTFILVSLLTITSAASAQHLSTYTYTNDDEWEIYEAWHNAFWDNNKRNYKADTAQPSADHRGNGMRDNDKSGCSSAIWCQAIYFDMAVNAYKRRLKDPSTSSSDLRKAKNRMSSVYAGEKAHYVNFDFDNSNTNNGWFVYDDIMWWTCALARAYQVSVLAEAPVDDYLTYSEKSFCRVWYGSQKVGDDGSYADPAETGADGKPFTGGMFWEWQPIDHAKPHSDNGFKSACINFPTVIACCTLYDCVPADREAPTGAYPTYQTKDFYLEKAKEIFAWATDHFMSSQYPGRIADGIHGGGPEFSDHLYNQATYIGAACMLYKITGEQQYLDHARAGADYVMKKMCKSSTKNDYSPTRGIKILPFEKGYEQGVYAAIFAQYIKMLIEDCGQTDYLPWIQDNIQYGLNNIDTTRKLQDSDFLNPVAADKVVESYEASALPALMIQFPVATDTAIKNTKNGGKKKSNVYTLDGKIIKSDASDLNGLDKGIYVLNGNKYVVK